MNKKICIGIDPDLRILSAAIVTDDLKLKAVFCRKNKGGSGDVAVANAARCACRLIEDVIAYFVADSSLPDCDTVLMIESQSMMHAKRMREQGQNVDYEDIRIVAQVTGCLMGAFSNMSSEIVLIQPMDWKKTTPKLIIHRRAYTALGIPWIEMGGKEPYCVPEDTSPYTFWCHDKPNPGDFKDISDSVGLALYGAKKGL